jgi:GMP synthase (glutamine-hydrolysing)
LLTIEMASNILRRRSRVVRPLAVFNVGTAPRPSCEAARTLLTNRLVRPLQILLTGDPVPSAQAQVGGFDAMFQRALRGVWDGPYEVLDLRTVEQLPEPGAAHAVIVSGSPHFVSEQLPWMLKGCDYMLALQAAGTPVLGVCFGHQLLAAALGGRVERNPRGREIGTVSAEVLRPNPLLLGGDLLRVNASHLDSIVELPPGASVCARTALDPNTLVHFGGAIWGVQFHPEFDAETVRCYLNERRERLLAEGLDADALLQQAHAAPEGNAVLTNFVRAVAGP